MNLSLSEISEAVHGSLDGPGEVLVRGYGIDTRTLNPGELFFAIKGPRFDGHDFLAQASEKGAAGVVIEAGAIEASATFGVIRVGSTAQALQDLATAVRRLWGKPIVGVTGSAGKTTTKEMIASVLAKRYTVLRSVGNLNNEFGLPLCLLRAESDQTIGVLEMGMSAKGEIRKLASIAEPNEGVVTNVNPVHLEFFDSIDGIAEAKAELLEGLVAPARAYLNTDDPRVRNMASKVSGTVVTYGVSSPADFRADAIKDLGLGGSAFSVRHTGRTTDFVLPLPGVHNISNALAAIAVGVTHGVSWEDVRDAVGEMKPEKMRGQIHRFKQGFDVIDDSYNSNPKALIEMIRFVGKLTGYSRRIVVAGEMLELGKDSAALHRACGKEAAAAGVQILVAVQGMAREVLEGAREGGVASDRLTFVDNAAQAGDFLARTVTRGDVVLIKGSRGVRLEQALNSLRAAFPEVEA